MDRTRVLILALACVEAGCMGGSATEEGPPTLIAYHAISTWGAPAHEIRTVRPDGSQDRRLVDGVYPSVSPDGRWVTYWRCNDPLNLAACTLHVIGSAGGKPRLLMRRDDPDGIVWSPDSDRIFVERKTGASTTSLLRIDVESGRQLELDGATSPFHGVSPSPSGDEVVYARGGEESTRYRLGQKVDLYVVGVDGGERRRLTFDGRSGFPVWGPEVIAFSRLLLNGGWGKDEIWLIEPDGRGRRTLSGPLSRKLIGHGFGGLWPFAWSEDGTRLLVGLTNEFGVQPYALDPENGALRKIGHFGFDSYVTGLSRDGRFVLVAVSEEGTDVDADYQVFVVPYHGGRAQLIATAAGSPSWNG